MMRCEIRKGIFDYFFIFHPFMCFPYLAWSGLKFVPSTCLGIPINGEKVCSFTSEEEARTYCAEHNLQPH